MASDRLWSIPDTWASEMAGLWEGDWAALVELTEPSGWRAFATGTLIAGLLAGEAFEWDPTEQADSPTAPARTSALAAAIGRMGITSPFMILAPSRIRIGSGHEPGVLELLGECERSQALVTVVAVSKWPGAVACLVSLGLAGCAPSGAGRSAEPAPRATSSASASATTAAPSPSVAPTGASVPPPTPGARSPTACTYRSVNGQGPLPDPVCTPGATNPAVAPSTISSTICASGWTSTVRPPLSVTEPQKYRSMAAYGDAGSAGDYEYDHLIPLELGGATDDAGNLWPQPHAGPWSSLAKDALENKLRELVCAGQLALAAAQRAIASDWIAAYQRYG